MVIPKGLLQRLLEYWSVGVMEKWGTGVLETTEFEIWNYGSVH